MSHYDKVRQWVLEDGYTPKNINMDEFISNIVSTYEEDLKADECPEDSCPLESWYETLCSIDCFDYK